MKRCGGWVPSALICIKMGWKAFAQPDVCRESPASSGDTGAVNDSTKILSRQFDRQGIIAVKPFVAGLALVTVGEGLAQLGLVVEVKERSVGARAVDDP